MASIIRPATTLTKPIAWSPIFLHHGRCLSSSSRRFIETGKTHHASTALKTSVREREEGSLEVRVVGDEVKGAEGPHYQGQSTRAILPEL
jgi:ubiquinol oxidase